MAKIGGKIVAVLSLILILLGVAACDTLIDANFSLGPFVGGDLDGQVLYLGMNDTTKCGGSADNAGVWTVVIKVANRAETFTQQVDSTVSTWQSTGIVIDADDTVLISASGQVRYIIGPDGVEGSCGPDGVEGDTSDPCYLAPGLPRHSLIGKIGLGEPFAIGARYESAIGPIAEGNFIPSDLSQEYLPLSEGSEWFWRDAKADWLPTHHPSSTILQQIAGATTAVDGVECYVLTTQIADEPRQYSYLHRTEDGVYEYARGTAATMTIYDAPICVYKLPFKAGESWTYERDGKIFAVTVLFQEVAVVSPTPDSPAQIYQSCWKLQIKADGITEYEWYARGVGRVKYVIESRNYELIRHQIGGLSS